MRGHTRLLPYARHATPRHYVTPPLSPRSRPSTPPSRLIFAQHLPLSSHHACLIISATFACHSSDVYSAAFCHAAAASLFLRYYDATCRCLLIIAIAAATLLLPSCYADARAIATLKMLDTLPAPPPYVIQYFCRFHAIF